ncbi:MAG TPA: transaldolase, partial [Acidimicrobiales bacterium]|nr:transaldolase [Acidimicrobiales bacterium]
MSRLRELFDQQGQSPWLDNLRRGWITSGELQALIDRGVRGITSNPSIFQKAMTGTDDYDEQLGALAGAGQSIEDSYWDLVTRDIVDALDLLRPVHEATGGLDGFVSVEVDPSLAADTAGTEDAARHLRNVIGRPNLFVKIPATAEGIPAIRTMVSEGCSVNVTLIFSLDRYQEVMEAYIGGLEDHEGDLSGISSVASFFISRTDTEIDRRLEAIGTPEALDLRGLAAVAQGQVAYDLFRRAFSGHRWEALAARGARVQRPLWA